jgi:hypothetical protein
VHGETGGSTTEDLRDGEGSGEYPEEEVMDPIMMDDE